MTPPEDITSAQADAFQGKASDYPDWVDSDPTLKRMAWTEEQQSAYAEAAARLCTCEGLCTCHWDDPGSLAMLRIEMMVQP